MPIYEYACKSCGHHLEVSQSFKDEPLSTCPVCGGPLRKVFNSIGIVLKGSGFYRTDSRLPAKSDKSDKAEKAEKGEKAADKGGEKAGGSGDKAEAKSESKSDSKPKAGESASSSSTKTA